MAKLLALLNLFRQGNAVANPAVWKNRGMFTAALVAVLAAAERVSAAFGYPLGVTDNDNVAIATGISAAVHVVLTLVTSDKVGLPTVDGGGSTGGGESGGDGEHESPSQSVEYLGS